MKLSVGIVGLPNVGKSTLFNALLKKQVADVANYPFCTIEPNVGIIEVPDERLAKLAAVVETEKIVPAAVEFYDIAGLVRGASEGAGLGNKFLSHIRETSLIVHVVRLFEDKNITHVDEVANPQQDIETIETELILADLSTLDKQREPRPNAQKEEKAAWETIQFVKERLNQGQSARDILFAKRIKIKNKINDLKTEIDNLKSELGKIEYGLDSTTPNWDKVERDCHGCGKLFYGHGIGGNYNNNLCYDCVLKW